MNSDFKYFTRINGKLVFDKDGSKKAAHDWPKERILELFNKANCTPTARPGDLKIIETYWETSLKLLKRDARKLDQLGQKYMKKSKNN